MLAPQINADIQLRRIVFNRSKPDSTSNRHQMDLHLDSGEVFSDAISRARGKREHSQPIPRMVGAKSIGIEASVLFPKVGMPLDEVWRNITLRTSRNEI